jgi:hypothetical protein
MLAKKVIRNEKLGLNKQKPEHTQYVVIMPVIIAALMAFGIVRFVGMGTGNRGLYITGGCCLVAGMALKQLVSVRGGCGKGWVSCTLKTYLSNRNEFKDLSVQFTNK